MPCKQYRLIHRDGLRISQYIARTFDGVAQSSHLRSDNYFYYNCCTGRFLKDCCPSYLTREGFNRLKSGRLESLHIVSAYFKEQLQARMYSKVTPFPSQTVLRQPAAGPIFLAIPAHAAQPQAAMQGAEVLVPFCRAYAQLSCTVHSLLDVKPELRGDECQASERRPAIFSHQFHPLVKQ